MKKGIQTLIFVLLGVLLGGGTLQGSAAKPAQKIVIGAHCHCGFFALFMRTLSMIDWARRNGKQPVVYWGAITPYFQNSGYYGQTNVWNYYFEPVSKLSYQRGDVVYQSAQTPDDSPSPENMMAYDDTFHNDLKWRFHEVVKQNIRIQPRILKKIWDFYVANMSGKTIIGIHLRGTDKHVDAIPVDPLVIFEAAQHIANSLQGDYRFFIATDEQRLLELAKEKLGAARVLHYDSYRSENGRPIHLEPTKKGKAVGKAAIGEQVLVEADLLSKCTYLLHTISNVATAAILFNPRINSVFFCQDKEKGLIIRPSNPTLLARS